VREALGDTAGWYVGAPLPEAGNNVAEAGAAIAAAPGWLSATVPGAVIDDLFRAGELPDPRRARNSRSAEWVAERSWVYRRAVDLPPVGDDEPLVSDRPAFSAASAFESLERNVLMPAAGRTLEDVVRELLRPMMKAWLDENLPAIVEAQVAAEVERIARLRRQ
jgi:cell pole-organizing protein PopZ